MALDGGRTERQTPADAPASAFLAVREVAAKGGWRHVVDAGAPIAAFLIGYQAAGPSAGVGAAVAVAIALTVLRLRRGDSPKVVVLSILGIVGYSALVLGTGEGRNFFVTEVVGCAILTVVFGIGTVLRRPLSLRICQRLRIEPRGETPERIRLHRWITVPGRSSGCSTSRFWARCTWQIRWPRSASRPSSSESRRSWSRSPSRGGWCGAISGRARGPGPRGTDILTLRDGNIP
ncbi:MAG: DUF3159 domain-containing protein [Gordonia sp.]|nr:DUF3159 domain-containing protein [Gordonia sp. (in: high G+C Gram-positive bacteria)]NLG45965.1 DUF3159 domain-containing protein [Gordonia sp. (in: high G+C Gram-positive bacteria)]